MAAAVPYFSFALPDSPDRSAAAAAPPPPQNEEDEEDEDHVPRERQRRRLGDDNLEVHHPASPPDEEKGEEPAEESGVQARARERAEARERAAEERARAAERKAHEREAMESAKIALALNKEKNRAEERARRAAEVERREAKKRKFTRERDRLKRPPPLVPENEAGYRTRLRLQNYEIERILAKMGSAELPPPPRVVDTEGDAKQTTAELVQRNVDLLDALQVARRRARAARSESKAPLSDADDGSDVDSVAQAAPPPPPPAAAAAAAADVEGEEDEKDEDRLDLGRPELPINRVVREPHGRYNFTAMDIEDGLKWPGADANWCFMCVYGKDKRTATHVNYSQLEEYFREHQHEADTAHVLKTMQDMYEAKLRKAKGAPGDKPRPPWFRGCIWRHFTEHILDACVTLEGQLKTMGDVLNVIRDHHVFVKNPTTGERGVDHAAWDMWLKTQNQMFRQTPTAHALRAARASQPR